MVCDQTGEKGGNGTGYSSGSSGEAKVFPMGIVPLSQAKDDLSKFLRLAEKEEIVITRHARLAGVLVGFASEDDWFEYRLEHDARFLKRIASARRTAAKGRRNTRLRRGNGRQPRTTTRTSGRPGNGREPETADHPASPRRLCRAKRSRITITRRPGNSRGRAPKGSLRETSE